MEKKRSWKATHEMFYFAMLAAGGLYDTWQTKVMFAAVYHFGPRWPDPVLNTAASVSQMTRDQFKTLAARIKQADALALASKEKFDLGESDTNIRVSDLDKYQTATTETVYFRINSHELTAEAKQQLHDIAQKAQSQKGYMIEVSGFGDTIAQEGKNKKLSEQRVDSVTKYLQNQDNIPTYRIISPIGMGTSHEAASNESAAGRKLSRRVEVKVLAIEPEQPTILSQIENWQPPN